MAMNSDEVLTLLHSIGMTTSRTEKEELLLEAKDDPLLRRVLTYTYDPHITYGLNISEVDWQGRGEHVFRDDSPLFWALLDELRARRLTGKNAIEVVSGCCVGLTESSARLLRMIVSKDLRCGISERTINKVIPNLIPTFNCMLAKPYDEKRSVWPVYVEPKYDGVRVICMVKDGVARFFSRSGKPFPAVEHLAEHIEGMMRIWEPIGTAVFDGEIVSGSFNKTVGDVRRKSEAALDAEFMIFDAVGYSDFIDPSLNVIGKPYVERRKVLEALIDALPPGSPIKCSPRYIANAPAEVREFYQKFRARGLEGAMVKDPNGRYDKFRSFGWMKIKAEETADLRIMGAYEGEGQFAGMLGGLVAEGHIEGQPISVRCGGGFSVVQRQDFWRAYEEDTAGHALIGPGKLIGRMIEVEYHEITPDGSLRHPRFIRFRDDKDEAA